MKISGNRLESFISDGAQSVNAVLFFGPDAGLVKERGTLLAKKVAPDLTDPFSVSHLSQDAILEDPALLGDHLSSLSMTGDRRLVMVSNATDRLSNAVGNALSLDNVAALLILEAGDLGPRSKLRSLAESSDSIAAIPCYTDSDRDIGRLISEVFGANKIECDRAGQAYLEQSIGNDRGISRSELEKLVIYAGPGGRLSFDDVMAIVGDNTSMTLSDMAFSATDGDALNMDKFVSRCLAEDIPPISILRAVANHLLRLQLSESKVRNGEPPDEAMKSLRPPIFFKSRDQFRRQLSRWRGPQISKGLSLLLAAERDCKKTGAPDFAICARTLHQIAALARQSSHRRP